MQEKFALLIGNSVYSDTRLSKLQAPIVDVTHLSRLLSDTTIGEFNGVVPLVDPPVATAQREIARFFSKRKRDDLLLLYFSGHGVLDVNGRLYFALTDTEHDLLSGTALPASFIRDEMENCLSRTQILILDCCHSGAFDKAKTVIGSSVGTGTIFQSTGKLILTATDALQVALEGDFSTGKIMPSVFTRYLINGLETGLADLDNDGLISVDELYEYAYNKVLADDSTSQTPMKIGKQRGKIILAKNPVALTLQNTNINKKSKRVYEILGTAYHDWVIFEKQDHRFLNSNDIISIFEEIGEGDLPYPLLDYIILSVIKERKISESGVHQLRRLFKSLDEYKIIELIESQFLTSDNQQLEWTITLINKLKLYEAAKPLMNLIETRSLNKSIIRHVLEVIYEFDLTLPHTLVQFLLRNQDDWMIHALALRSINATACLLISDGSKFANDLGMIIQNVGVGVSVLNASEIHEIEMHGGYDLLKPYTLIVLIRGEHYSSMEGDIFQLLLREYVKNGGKLFATSWFSWEIIHSGSVIADVLPFSHNLSLGRSYYEDIQVECKPTQNELSMAFFTEAMTFRSSFEPLHSKEKSIVLLEQKTGTLVLGYHYFYKGVCYYLNTCQHSCTTEMPSPIDIDLNFRRGLEKFFEWVFVTNTQHDLNDIIT